VNSGDSVSDAGNLGASIFCGARSSIMPLSDDGSAGNARGVTEMIYSGKKGFKLSI